MIVLVRVDNRLLHGQILEAWVPKLRIDEVWVVDEEAAASDFACAAMTLCVPPELPAHIARPAAVPWADLAASRRLVLVLVRDVAGLEAAVRAGLTPALARKVNVGNVHFGPGRYPVTPSVFLSGEEVAALRRIASAGFEIEARAIPSEPPAGMEDIERRYAAAR